MRIQNRNREKIVLIIFLRCLMYANECLANKDMQCSQQRVNANLYEEEFRKFKSQVRNVVTISE